MVITLDYLKRKRNFHFNGYALVLKWLLDVTLLMRCDCGDVNYINWQQILRCLFFYGGSYIARKLFLLLLIGVVLSSVSLSWHMKGR